MSWLSILAWTGLLLAAASCALICWNLCLLRRLPVGTSGARLSVLIPARNEAGNIDAAIASVLASTHESFELLVMDDESTDDTAEVVNRWTARDSRVRLLHRKRHDPSLWGKPQACGELAMQASGDCLVFMDADVRLEADALARIAARLDRADSALISGLPRQKTGTLAEKLIVPLIHFVLLGYLPLAAMRTSPNPGFGVACGQLLAVRRDAYFDSGGHLEITHCVHDGMALARLLRSSGYMTDLADFTDLAHCRMYRSVKSLIAGFAKNAHEGLGSRRGILPWTVLLLGGQCAWAFLLFPAITGAAPWLVVSVGGVLACLSRALVSIRFRQSLIGALLHPIGILGLVAIQWYAALRRAFGQPVAWKSRVAADPAVSRSGTSRAGLQSAR